MQFELSLDIDAPAEEVWQAFADPANLPYWQPSLQSYEAISGEPGWPGAVSLLVYHERGKLVKMTATIKARDEGRHLSGHYESEWAVNEMACTFEALPDGGTRWRALAEFRFKGWVKAIAPLLRSGIQKRLEDDMLRFKTMVESREPEATAVPPPRARPEIRPQHPR